MRLVFAVSVKSGVFFFLGGGRSACVARLTSVSIPGGTHPSPIFLVDRWVYKSIAQSIVGHVRAADARKEADAATGDAPEDGAA